MRTKRLVLKIGRKQKQTKVEKHIINEAEHSLVDNTKESTETTEKQNEKPAFEINLRHSNLVSKSIVSKSTAKFQFSTALNVRSLGRRYWETEGACLPNIFRPR